MSRPDFARITNEDPEVLLYAGYAASCFCKSYSTPTSLNINPRIIKNSVPPTDQIKAPVINPYSQSPKKKIGIPMLKPNKIGVNSTIINTEEIKLVPRLSMILENLIVSS